MPPSVLWLPARRSHTGPGGMCSRLDLVSESVAAAIAATLTERSAPHGGFSPRKGEAFDVASSLWAALALRGLEAQAPLVAACEDRLVACQLSDGRVPAFESEPAVFWPTALFVWLLAGARKHADSRARAVEFLQGVTGLHPKQRDWSVGIDPSLLGWPWVEATFSWVEPTAYSILALCLTGDRDQPRVTAGVSLLLDRQLPDGGWNYGNTTVFGHALDAAPDSTGHALAALAGLVARHKIEKSLAYLASRTSRLRTPLCLAWGLLGLSSWARRPQDALASIAECLQLQKRFGPYDTALLAQLALAARAERGIVEWIRGTAP